MERNVLSSIKRNVVVGVLLGLPLFAAAQNPDSKSINDLLKEAETHAMSATEDAELLQSYTRGNTMSWESHANRLTAIKEHANNLILDFNQLSTMRQQGSPWQQEAIDRVNPLLQEMSNHLSATIQHFNDNKERIHMPAFRDYVKANREYMDKASQLVSDFVQYGEMKAKANSLETALQVPAEAASSKE